MLGKLVDLAENPLSLAADCMVLPFSAADGRQPNALDSVGYEFDEGLGQSRR